MSFAAITASAEKLAARMGGRFVPHKPQKLWRAQLINVENKTAVWFEFDTEDEARAFGRAINTAIAGHPIDAIVGAYRAGETCPVSKRS